MWLRREAFGGMFLQRGGIEKSSGERKTGTTTKQGRTKEKKTRKREDGKRQEGEYGGTGRPSRPEPEMHLRVGVFRFHVRGCRWSPEPGDQPLWARLRWLGLRGLWGCLLREAYSGLLTAPFPWSEGWRIGLSTLPWKKREVPLCGSCYLQNKHTSNVCLLLSRAPPIPAEKLSRELLMISHHLQSKQLSGYQWRPRHMTGLHGNEQGRLAQFACHFGEKNFDSETSGFSLRAIIGLNSSDFMSLFPKALYMPLKS